MIFNITSSDLTGTTLVVETLAGVTVTITKDKKSKVQIANSNGIAIFKGLEIGTWTVTITDGSQTAQKTVTITEEAVAISYATYLYNRGDECTEITGGWKAVSGTITKNADHFVVNNGSVIPTTNKISTVGYKTITVKALSSAKNQWFGFGNSNNSFSVGQVALPTGSIGEVSVDLTGIQGSYYPIFAANNSNTIKVYSVVMTK